MSKCQITRYVLKPNGEIKQEISDVKQIQFKIQKKFHILWFCGII